MRGHALGAAALLLLLPPTSAHAHADLVRSEPAAGATLTSAPSRTRLVLSEDIAAASRLTVTDGCGRDVTGPVEVDGRTVATALRPGQPGSWTVVLETVSADDGHPSRTSYGLVVQGDPACTAETGPADGGDSGRTAGAGDGARTTAFLVVGALVVLGAGALQVRRRGRT